jgi:hypothetical protein
MKMGNIGPSYGPCKYLGMIGSITFKNNVFCLETCTSQSYNELVN